MRKITRASLVIFLWVASFSTVSAALPGFSVVPANSGIAVEPALHRDSSLHIDVKYKASLNRLSQQGNAIKEYLIANNYNTEICFLIDMSIPSGKKRLFIYNLSTGVVEQSALVTHGIGSNRKDSDQLQFSNEPSSLQTSLGKYKIGASYNGHYGLAYKLFGLDKTNSKAYERGIVLHSFYDVPTVETYPVPIGESFGCPTVAPSFLETMSDYIKGSRKPILMWIYN
jgi:hypothetical protein